MTNFDNLTAEESDNLLRQEIFAEEDSNSESGINDSQEQVEEVTEEVETTETETIEEESQPTEEEKPKKKSNVAKLLSEKNEHKRNWLQAQERIKELESQLWQDTATDKEYFETVVKKQLAEEMEKNYFFTKNPDAYEAKWDLDALIEENPSLSYDRAWKFYLAETNPQALLDEQTQNKLNSKVYSSSWRAPANVRNTKVEYDYSDAELDKLIKEWKVRL